MVPSVVGWGTEGVYGTQCGRVGDREGVWYLVW